MAEFSAQPAEEFRQQVIAVDRVARVVAGGRRFRFRAIVVVGDGHGQVGIGVGKAGEVGAAVEKAAKRARAHLYSVPLTETGSIPHAVTARFAGAEVLLKPAGAGTGVIAGGAVRLVLETLGITNVLSKAFGSSNKLNNCYATMAALQQLRANPAAQASQQPLPSGEKT